MDEYIDRKRWVMNYPYGEYNDAVVEFAKHEGACLGLTTEPREANLDIDPAMELPRMDCKDF
jgi:hypothetical protein